MIRDESLFLLKKTVCVKFQCQNPRYSKTIMFFIAPLFAVCPACEGLAFRRVHFRTAVNLVEAVGRLG
jgi:hypothetical protein